MKTTRRTDWLGLGTMVAFAMAGAAACSNSSTPAPSEAGVPEASRAETSTEAGVPEASSAETSTDGGASTVTLTVLNFLDWCSVTINGGAASSAASVEGVVADGSTATLVATPASASFQIGADPWFGVTENGGGAAAGMDNGAGATETTTATVVVTGNQCVSVCCQLPGNGPPACPTVNPCP